MRIEQMYPGNHEKVRKMAIIYDGQVKMAHLAIAAGYSVNGVARLHTEILKNQEFTHQFRHCHSRVGIIQLECHLLMELADILMIAQIFRNCFLYRCRDKEILLF